MNPFQEISYGSIEKTSGNGDSPLSVSEDKCSQNESASNLIAGTLLVIVSNLFFHINALTIIVLEFYKTIISTTEQFSPERVSGQLHLSTTFCVFFSASSRDNFSTRHALSSLHRRGHGMVSDSSHGTPDGGILVLLCPPRGVHRHCHYSAPTPPRRESASLAQRAEFCG